MSAFTPAYRLILRAPRSVDPTETAVLTGDGTVHSDPFQVSTLPNDAGYKPYLTAPTGHTGRLDPQTCNVEVGQVSAIINDQSLTPGSNLTRWVTGFLSAATTRGQSQLNGCRAEFTISLDGGVTWAAYFTGRVVAPSLNTKAAMQLTVQGMASELVNAPCFTTNRPHSSITYDVELQLLPAGYSAAIGTIPGAPALTGTIGPRSDGGATVDADGTAIKLITVDPASVTNAYNVVTTALDSTHAKINAEGLPTYGGWRSPRAGAKKVLARLTSGGGTGDFYLLSYTFYRQSDGHFAVTQLLIEPLPVGSLNYMALPADGTAISVTVRPSGTPPAADAPVILDNVSFPQVASDLLDGKFGDLDSTGAVTRSWAKDVAGFATVVADTSFPKRRWVIPAPAKIGKWLADNGKVEGLAIVENAAGQMSPVDLRQPTSAAGVPTLVDDDLVSGEPAQWSADSSGAISRMSIRIYTDTFNYADGNAGRVAIGSNAFMPNLPSVLFSTTYTDIIVNDLGTTDPGVQPFSIDATSLRTTPGETYQGIQRADAIWNQALAIAQRYRQPYGGAPMSTTMVCRRSPTVQALTRGQLLLLGISWLPDPQTNKRGGVRLVRVLSIADSGPKVTVAVQDLGPNSVCGVPTLGALAAGADAAHYATTALTLDADADIVQLHVAATATTVGVRPADTDPAWGHQTIAAAGGTWALGPVPQGLRLWARGRSVSRFPKVTHALASPWAYPAGAGYLDTTPVPAATSVTVSAVTSKSATLTINLGGNTTLGVRILLGQGASQAASDASTPALVIDLKAGTTHYVLNGLDAGGPWYKPQVVLVEPGGGVSAAAGATPTSFQATGTPAIIPVPQGMCIIPMAIMHAATPGAAVDLAAGRVARTGYAVNVLPGRVGDDLLAWEAPDVAGSPGAFVNVDVIPAARIRDTGIVWTRELPDDATPRWVTFSARSVSGTDSPTIPPVQVLPGVLPVASMDQLAATPLRRDRGLGGAKRSISQLQSWLVPNGEFDLWETLSQPHAWALDLSAGATVAQDAAGLASGDYALKWSCPNTTANTGWHGASTNDPTVGAFCVPLRPGMRYRALLTSKVSRITEGQQFRITLDFGAGGTLQQAWAYTSAGAFDRYELVSFLVPANASPNTKATIEFNGQGYSGGNVDFTLDSIRFDEETTDYETLARRDQTTAYGVSVNGDFEDGLRFWEIRSSGNHHITADTVTVYKGAKSLKITTTVNTATIIVQQSTRSSDLDVSSVADSTIRAVRVRQGDVLYVRGTMRVDTSGIGPTQYLGVSWWAGTTPTGVGTFQQVAGAISGTSGTWYTYEGFWQVPAGVDWAAPTIKLINQNIVDTIRVDELSIIRLAAGRAAKVYLDTAVQVLANNAETAVNFVTEAFDQGGFWASGTPSRLTIPGTAAGAQKYDGIYRIEGSVQFASNATGRRKVRIRKNGATILGAHVENAVNGEDHILQVVAEDANPAPGDYYELLAFQTAGGNLNLQIGTGATWFAIHQIK